MLTRDEQSTIFGGAATILGINEMLNAQLRPASIMANAPLTERVATVAEAFEKVGDLLADEVKQHAAKAACDERDDTAGDNGVREDKAVAQDCVSDDDTDDRKISDHRHGDRNALRDIIPRGETHAPPPLQSTSIRRCGRTFATKA